MKVLNQLFFSLTLSVLIIFTFTSCSEVLSGDWLDPIDDSPVTALTGTTHQLTWDTMEDAIGYQVQIAESEAELFIMPVIDVEKPSYSFKTPLAVGTALYWRVRPKTSNGEKSEWSTVYVYFVKSQEKSDQESNDTDENTVEDKESKEDKKKHDDEPKKASDENTVEDKESIEDKKKHDDESKKASDENDRENHYDESDEHIYIDPSEISMEEWEDLMGEFFAWDASSQLPPDESDFKEAIEFCNRRSSAEGKDPAYRFFSGEAILIPWADGYRLKPMADWGGRYKDKQKNKREGRWPYWDSPGSGRPWRGKEPGHESPDRWNSGMSALSPSEDEIVTRAIVPFHWDSVDGAASYQIQIWDAMMMVNMHSVEVEDSFHAIEALPNGAWHWRARAIGQKGEEGEWSDIIRFRKQWGIVRNLQPPVNSMLDDRTPTLSWDEVSDTVSYQLQITRAGSSFMRSDIIDLSESDYTPKNPLDANQMYFWRVRAVDVYGQVGFWSKVSSFSIDSLPVVSGLKPDDGTVTYNTRQSLSWEPVDDAEKYQILLTNSLNMVAASVPVDVISGEEYLPLQDLSLGVWYWQVRSVSGNETVSQWSPIQNFRSVMVA